MAGIEIVLILAGIVMMIGSFFITEKLSPSEIDHVAKLNENEMKLLLEKNLNRAKERLSEETDQAVDESFLQLERKIDKETNEKIMAINEYADTVMDDIHKTHDEIMFLYAMLNDRQQEIKNQTEQLKNLSEQIEEQRKFHEAYLEGAQDTVRQTIETVNVSTIPENTSSSAQYAVPELDTISKPKLDMDEKAQETPKKQRRKKKTQDTETDVASEDGQSTQTIDSNPQIQTSNAGASDQINQMILELASQGKEPIEIAKELGLGTGMVNLVIGLYKGA